MVGIAYLHHTTPAPYKATTWNIPSRSPASSLRLDIGLEGFQKKREISELKQRNSKKQKQQLLFGMFFVVLGFVGIFVVFFFVGKRRYMVHEIAAEFFEDCAKTLDEISFTKKEFFNSPLKTKVVENNL